MKEIFEGKDIEEAIAQIKKKKSEPLENMNLEVERRDDGSYAIEYLGKRSKDDGLAFIDQKSANQSLVDRLLDCWSMDLKAEYKVEDHWLIINLTGEDVNLLMEHKMAKLMALDYVLSLHNRKNFPKSIYQVFVDANMNRYNKLKELDQIAESACKKVSQNYPVYEMSPMNPFERRRIHLFVKNISHCESFSQGDGHYKSIVIKYVPQS